MATEVLKRLLNVDEYYQMAEAGILKPDDRVELIHGEIYEMSPIGSKHAAIVNRLARLLNKILEQSVSIGIQSPIRLSQVDEPEPDISIAKYKADDYLSSLPNAEDVLLLIEVADSSIQYDRTTKKPLYASHGIPEYWIIDIENEIIEVYQKPINSDYTKNKSLQKGDSVQLLDRALKVADIFPGT